MRIILPPLIAFTILLGLLRIAHAEPKKSSSASVAAAKTDGNPSLPTEIQDADAKAFNAMSMDAELAAARADAAKWRAEAARLQLLLKYQVTELDEIDPQTRAIKRGAKVAHASTDKAKGGGK